MTRIHRRSQRLERTVLTSLSRFEKASLTFTLSLLSTLLLFLLLDTFGTDLTSIPKGFGGTDSVGMLMSPKGMFAPHIAAATYIVNAM